MDAIPIKAMFIATYEKERDAAVYVMASRKTGAMYVGASMFFDVRRKLHLYHIRKGTHPNRKIREAFAGHGPDDIEVRVLERVSVSDAGDKMYLMHREGQWITKLQPSLNSLKRQWVPVRGMPKLDLSLVEGLA